MNRRTRVHVLDNRIETKATETEKSHAKTQRREEKRDFEQELTEVTEFSVSSLSSCIEILCLRCPPTRKKETKIRKQRLSLRPLLPV
jgi:hypothetical protein